MQLKDRDSSTPDDKDLKWIKREDIKDQQLIEQYFSRETKKRQVELIVGAAPTNSEIWFHVKWMHEYRGAWLPAHILHKKYPQELIKFYEQHLFLT